MPALCEPCLTDRHGDCEPVPFGNKFHDCGCLCDPDLSGAMTLCEQAESAIGDGRRLEAIRYLAEATHRLRRTVPARVINLGVRFRR